MADAELIEFLRDLTPRHNLRTVADWLDLSPEALRKIVDGRTEQPHPGTMESVRDLFRALHPGGEWKVAESAAAPPTGYIAELLKLLPRGREQSEAALQPMLKALRATNGRRGLGTRLADLLTRMWDEGQKGQAVYATARQLKQERKAAERMLAEKAKQQKAAEAEPGGADAG